MPLDNTKLEAHIPPELIDYGESQETLRIGNLELFSITDPRLGKSTKHQCVKENLRFTYGFSYRSTDKVLVIENSLHKFIKDENYSDFKLSELKQAIDRIETLTWMKAKDFRIKKLEFALNISVAKPPYKYLPFFTDFKGRELDKMKAKAFCYGIKYPLSEYALKIYDKTEHLKRTEGVTLPSNLMRFEIQYFKSRKMPYLETLHDLRDKSKIDNIYRDFITQFKKVNCKGDENFTQMSSKERELYFAGQSSKFWIVEKAQNRETAKKKIQKYRQLQKIHCNHDVYNGFIKKLDEKYRTLIET